MFYIKWSANIWLYVGNFLRMFLERIYDGIFRKCLMANTEEVNLNTLLTVILRIIRIFSKRRIKHNINWCKSRSSVYKGSRIFLCHFEWFINQNCCIFNKFYGQKSGLCMSSPLNLLLTDIFMSYLEEAITKKYFFGKGMWMIFLLTS